MLTLILREFTGEIQSFLKLIQLFAKFVFSEKDLEFHSIFNTYQCLFIYSANLSPVNKLMEMDAIFRFGFSQKKNEM